MGNTIAHLIERFAAICRNMMAKGITPSILDRLLPLRTAQPDGGQSALLFDNTLVWSADAERDAVRQDLENLLNTRVSTRLVQRLPAALRSSVLAYGLPEITTTSAHDEAEHEAVCAAVQTAIETFEPRLHRAEVHLVPTRRPIWQLQLRITADLILQVSSERVVFDATLPVMTRRFEVKEKPSHDQ